jgi:hypothetical protein
MRKVKRLGKGTFLEIVDTKKSRNYILRPGPIEIGGDDIRRSRSGIVQWTPKTSENGLVLGEFVYKVRGLWRICKPMEGIDAPLVAGGAFPLTSCLPGDPIRNTLTGGQYFNLESLTQKLPMFTNAITSPTMNNPTATDWCYGVGSWDATHEVSGTSYSAGGPTVPNPSLLNDGGILRYKFNDILLSQATITGIHGGVICDTSKAISGHPAIHTLLNFGDDFSVDGTDFVVSPSSEGAWFWGVNQG